MAFPPGFEERVYEAIPFHKWLGLKVRAGSIADPQREGSAHAELPYRIELVGDPRRPALHGGIIATLLDACGGYAAWSSLTLEDKVSTIDLRVDYLHHASAEALIAEANVVRLGKRVAVVDIRCWQASNPEVICATGKGVYNIRRKGD
jgi:uncharacterized protein (TIGR00369 family)